jgi:hypothetical protein
MTSVFQAPEESNAAKAELVTLSVTGLVDEDGLVDLNKIVQESLEGVKKQLTKLSAILRCDKLPHVQAGAADMKQLCDQLVHLILRYPPPKSKLFIYIKCKRLDSDMLSASLTGGQHTFEICFHTNSCNDAFWQTAHVQELNECARMCTQYSGAFASAYGHTDCLFKITLPGKLL